MHLVHQDDPWHLVHLDLPLVLTLLVHLDVQLPPELLVDPLVLYFLLVRKLLVLLLNPEHLLVL